METLRNAGASIVIFFAAIFTGAATLGVADVPTAGGPLVGRQIIDTQPFVCDAAQHVTMWTNDTGNDVHIRKMQIWMGMDMAGRGDFWAWVSRPPDGTALGHTNWDRYAEPAGPHNVTYDYAPDYVTIAAGEQVALRYGCAPLGDAPNGHVTVTIWYLELDQ